MALRRNQQQDLVTVNECKTALDEVLKSLQNKLDESDQNFFTGILKFADRAKKDAKVATCKLFSQLWGSRCVPDPCNCNIHCQKSEMRKDSHPARGIQTWKIE